MPSKHTAGKVREFQMNMEDAARLADCFNSFDDSDSWPGGFTHGNPYTAERVLQQKQKSEELKTLVAYDDDKIVGHCNVCPAEGDEEAAYVGLLGVRPDYQGKGFGKAMLIEATELAAHLGKRRIDLHTWPGNLKAMPLYKRVGYNWVPNTRVLMESYVPGILNCSLFKQFFEKYYWYDVLKRDIRQEPDDIRQDGIAVYEYHFEGESGDRLDVTVDRFARGMCGFRLVLNGETLEMRITPERHVGFIGVGRVPVHLRVRNGTSRPVDVSIDPEPQGGLRLDTSGPLRSTIQPDADFLLDAVYQIEPGIRPHDETEQADVKVKTQCEWRITIDGQTVYMYSGLLPTEALALSYGPEWACVAPGETARVTLQLRNNAPETVRGKVVITGLESRNIENREFEFTIERNDLHGQAVTIPTTKSDRNQVLRLRTEVYIDTEQGPTRIRDAPLQVAVIGAAGACAYEAPDGVVFLETETFRLQFMKGPHPIVANIYFKTTAWSYRGYLMYGMPGYPFPTEGGEWLEKEYEYTFRNEGDIAEVSFTGVSRERLGLVVTWTFRAYGGTGRVEIWMTFENRSSESMTNLGALRGSWADTSITRMYVPLRGKIYELSSEMWGGGRYLPKKPEDYHETWIALVDDISGSSLGYVWSNDRAVEVIPFRDHASLNLESKIPDLEHGESATTSILTVLIGEHTWRAVRQYWAYTNARTALTDGPIQVAQDLSVGIVPADSDSVTRTGAPVIIDSATGNTMALRVQVIHEVPLTGRAIVRAPRGVLLDGESELEFDIEDLSIERPFVKQFEMTCKNYGPWLVDGGEIELRFADRIVRVPLRVILWNSKSEVERGTRNEGGVELHEVRVGSRHLCVAPSHSGSLIRLGPTDDVSLFYDTFPEIKPYAWTDQMLSGLSPIICGHNTWDWETGLRREEWEIEDVDRGPWTGFSVKSTLKHTPRVEGLRVRYDYLIMKGAPIAAIVMTATNETPRWVRATMGVRGVIRPGGDTLCRIRTSLRGKPSVFEPTATSTTLYTEADENWVAFRGLKHGVVTGAIAQQRLPAEIRVDHIGDHGHILQMSSRLVLRPGEEARRVWFVVWDCSEDVVETLKTIQMTLFV